jgi:hypothetical protein
MRLSRRRSWPDSLFLVIRRRFVQQEKKQGRPIMSTILKVLVAMAVIAALAESSAFAGSRTRHSYRAYYPARVYRAARAPTNEDLLIRGPYGRVVGTDPDASIRAYMRRDGIGANATGVSSGQ